MDKLIEKWLRLCQELGWKSYIVWWAVRDMLMGAEIHDVDIATNISIEEIESKLDTVNIGKNKDFWIVVVNFEWDMFEVAHFRKDGKYSDNRRPDDVELVDSLEDDLARRDFTINAMAYDWTTVIDLFGGQDDIKKWIIRFVGKAEDRIAEDGLRVLRAYRFAARFKFQIVDEQEMTWWKPVWVAQERVTEEFRKVASYWPKALAFYLHRTSWNQIYSYGFSRMSWMPHHIKHHPEGDVFEHTISCLSHASEYSEQGYLAALCVAFHDIGKIVTAEYKTDDLDIGYCTYYGHDIQWAILMNDIWPKLKLSSDEIKAIQFVCQYHMIRWEFKNLKESKKLEIARSPYYPLLEYTTHADEMSRLYLADYERRCDIAAYVQSWKTERDWLANYDEKVKLLIDWNMIKEYIPNIKDKDIGILKKAALEFINDNSMLVDKEQVKQFILNLTGDANS